jgi:hypothetical protein
LPVLPAVSDSWDLVLKLANTGDKRLGFADRLKVYVVAAFELFV